MKLLFLKVSLEVLKRAFSDTFIFYEIEIKDKIENK